MDNLMIMNEMAAFVVISTDNRLSGLVDGIEKCLPLNPAVGVHVSTGKIEKRNESVFYTYLINGESKENDQPVSFANLLLNQIAAFRGAYNVQDLLHIFVLENPKSSEELQELKGWLQEMGDVYTQDKNIYIHRLCFDYNLNSPDDVAQGMPSDVLEEYIDSKEPFAFSDNAADMLYIGNRDIHGAAVVNGKKDHDFLLPRMLTDFMLLLSSTNNSYTIMNALHQLPARCASIGYAESMYYFPDVRDYYEHADLCSLYSHILNGDDETQAMQDDSDAMDITRYPLGLYERRERLEKYEDVPYDVDIDSHKDSADLIIDKNLLKLKDLLVQKRQDDIERKQQEIKEREEEEEELRKELDDYINALPQFISREDIFNHCRGLDDEDAKEDYLQQAGEQYKKIVRYAKSNDFFDYVKKHEADKPAEVVAAPKAERQGCWAKFMPHWKKPAIANEPQRPCDEQPPLTDCVNNIRHQTEMKASYKSFKKRINAMETKREVEEKFCDDFQLSDHSHHVYHLINLDEMKKYQKAKIGERLQQLLEEWASGKRQDRTMARLEELLHKATIQYTNTLKYVDWDKPFPFVSDTSDEKLTEICGDLYTKSSPFVHYEKTDGMAQNDINMALYSDIPQIENRVKDSIKGIKGGAEILTYHSSLVASKICCLQILPLDKTILKTSCPSIDE